MEWSKRNLKTASVVQKAKVKVRKPTNKETDSFVTKLNAETAFTTRLWHKWVIHLRTNYFAMTIDPNKLIYKYTVTMSPGI